MKADVLYALRVIGHGDALVVAVTNFPAHSVAKHTGLSELLHKENITAASAARATLSIMPLDTFVADLAGRMDVVGDDCAIPAVQQQVQKVIDAAEGSPREMISIERFDFHERAKGAYCIIQTRQPRLYGCFVLRKGVIAPENET